MKLAIAITGIGSISPLGARWRDVALAYTTDETRIRPVEIDGVLTPAAELRPRENELLKELQAREAKYERVDRSVLMAIHAAMQAVRDAAWEGRRDIGINIGSSRGATELFEAHYRAYCAHPERRVPPSASPSTTLGNLSSWVGQAVRGAGITFSHSITCSTALHAVANGIAWLTAGMAPCFLVGGTEAALTGFSIAQMKALRLYAPATGEPFPCRPLARGPRNSLVLGEGAAVLALEPLTSEIVHRTRALIVGLGYATERIRHGTSLSTQGYCLRESMHMALASMQTEGRVDAIIPHAPGTVRGDAAELNAIEHVFGDDLPLLLSNKWRIGHCFGASGALSLEFAAHLLASDEIPVDFPYPVSIINRPTCPRRVMVNAVGFGGNAVSVILEKASSRRTAKPG